MDYYFSKYDAFGKQKYFSKEVIDMLGYDHSDLVGKFAYDYFHPYDLKQISKAHAEISKPLYITTAVYRIRHKNGSYIWVRSYSEMVDGELISFTRKLSIIEILWFRINQFIPSSK